MIIINRKAPIIKAWHVVFPHIRHLQYYIHFIKNITDKMKYKMHAVTKYQQKEVILLVHDNKAINKFGLTDMSVNQIDKFLPHLNIII